MYTCEYCNAQVKTKSSLKTHQSTAKYCLKIRGETNTKCICQYCNSIFGSKYCLKSHHKICKKKEKTNVDEIIEKNNAEYEKRIEIITRTYEEKIQYLEKLLDSERSSIKDLASQAINKPTTSIKNTVNLYNVDHLDMLTEEDYEKMVSEYTLGHALRESDGIAEIAVNNLLRGKAEMADRDRKKMITKGTDGKAVVDYGMFFTGKKIISMIAPKHTEIIKDYVNSMYDEDPSLEPHLRPALKFEQDVRYASKGEINKAFNKITKKISAVLPAAK